LSPEKADTPAGYVLWQLLTQLDVVHASAHWAR
jgi:hypothetical protein